MPVESCHYGAMPVELSCACRVPVKPCLWSCTRSTCRALGPAPETPTSARRVVSAYLGLGLTASGLLEWVALGLPVELCLESNACVETCLQCRSYRAAPVELGRWSQACRVVPVEPCQVYLASLKPAPETLDSAYLPRTLRVLRGSFVFRRSI